MVVAESQTKTDARSGLREQARALAVVLKEEFGVDFNLFEATTGIPVSCEDWPPLAPDSSPDLALPPTLDARTLTAEGRARVVPCEGGYALGLLLYHARRPALVATARMEALARTEAESVRERARLQSWLQAVGDRLRLTDQYQVRRRHDEDRSQSTTPWEALLTLDQVMRRLRVHKQPEKGQQRVLEAAFGLLGVQTLVWVPQHPDHPVLSQGKGGLAAAEYRQLVAMLGKHPEFHPPGPVWLELSQGKSWKNRFPSITNLMAFQAADHGPLGWIVAINKLADPGHRKLADRDKPDGEPLAMAPFRRTDAALLMPFVALLEMHARGTDRYQDLKDLLVGLTRSLTTALDAKDSYTFGHSERVARIAVELGREMGLGGEELGDIYLAGLLHDIGKIGIRDTVLLKPDTLTPEEREHIKQHVTIGYSILADLRQIRNLLPGVLYHHERIDGTGYPDGLAGENIPLLGRILAVADAYDAMSTARPYRDAIPFRKVEEILLGGMDTQWDKQVVEAFMRCRQRIHTIRQRGVGDSLRLAIEGTLRSDSRPLRGVIELHSGDRRSETKNQPG